MWFKNQGFVPDDGLRASQFNPRGTIPFPEGKNMQNSSVGCWKAVFAS